jgi:hypothetical protein
MNLYVEVLALMDQTEYCCKLEYFHTLCVCEYDDTPYFVDVA